MALIKSKNEIATLRKAGSFLAEAHKLAKDLVRPGANILDIDRAIEAKIRELGAVPAFLGYGGFPNSACISVNNQVIHGIPDNTQLQEGDVVSIDLGLWYAKLCVDAATTVGAGTISPVNESLIKATEEALAAGIRAARPFRRVGAISAAIEAVANHYNLGIVRGYTGHGVGHAIHESPDVPNVGKPHDGMLLKPGMVLAIEPMFTLGGGEVKTEIDGWTVTTLDGSIAAHAEHTVAITQKGAEILTRLA